jgi:hypothetical protein
MLTDTESVSLRSDTAEAPAARRVVAQEGWELPVERSPAPEEPPRSSRRRRLRWALFLLLPLALIVGAYFYVEGGAYMSTDDAYIKADKVGLSTDVSGMVETIEVSDNQHVTAGQVLFRLDPLPFQLKLDQAQSQLGIVRDNLTALKANYQNVEAQIKQAEDQIAFNQLQYQRQETLARQQFTPQNVIGPGAAQPADFAANAGFRQGAVGVNRREPRWESRYSDRAAFAIPPGSGTARRSGARAARYHCQGAVQRHRDQRPFLGAGNVSAGLDHRL